MNRAELARELGVSRETVCRYARRLGLDFEYKSSRELQDSEIETLRRNIQEGTLQYVHCPECEELGHSKGTCPNTEQPRECPTCRILKPRDQFYVRPTRRGKGLSGECRTCNTSHSSERYSTPEGRAGRLIASARTRSEVTIDVQDIMNMLEGQNWKCFYSGRLMTSDRGFYGFSIDRKNNKDRNYSKENVVLCLYGVNLMKRDMEVDEFMFFCKAIRDVRGEITL